MTALNGSGPTAIADWVGPADKLVTLPSGNVARVREKFPVYVMLRDGKFSEELWNAFGLWTRGELNDPVLAAELLDLIVTSMFVEPKVSRTPGEDELSIDVLSDDDIAFVLAGAVGGGPDGTFPGVGDGAANGVDGEGVVDTPVVDAGDDTGNVGGAVRGQPSGAKGRRPRAARAKRAAR